MVPVSNPENPCSRFPKLFSFQILDDVVHRGVADVRLTRRWWSIVAASAHASLAAFWLFNLQIDARIVFHTHDAEHGADCFCCRAGATDDFAHVVFMHG